MTSAHITRAFVPEHLQELSRHWGGLANLHDRPAGAMVTNRPGMMDDAATTLAITLIRSVPPVYCGNPEAVPAA